MKADISNRADIDLLMKKFYNKLLLNEGISYLFTDIFKIDLEIHLPIIGNFWEMVLLQQGVYQKNVMKIHQDMNLIEKFTKEHFRIWLETFYESIDELFLGERAIMAKQRAQSIATMMQIKMNVY